MDRIRARYFKNHEIVYANHLDHLDACRYGIHSVLVAFEEQRGGDDSWIARLTDPSLPVEGEPTDSDYVDHQKRVQERINHAARNTVRELVHQAHFEALDFVGETAAADRVMDKELEAMFAEEPGVSHASRLNCQATMAPRPMGRGRFFGTQNRRIGLVRRLGG